ncbi:hypothetical protein ACA910_018417 [Epithemia clementina (nom. ined.)]
MVSVTGEGAIPAFFLPRGSTLILYYDDVREFVIRGNQQKSSRRPAMVDWDLWNHASHLNVHWLPLSSMESSESMTVLLSIVRNEVESLQRQQDNSTAAVRRQHGIAPPTDAWFGVEQVEYIPQPPVSLVHCLGDNFVSKEAPCYRSCHIRHLCLDTNTSEFVIFSSITQNTLDDSVEQLPDNEFARISTVMRNMSVMEGRNIRFSTNLPWFPKIRQVVDPNNNTEMRGFYLLPEDVMLIPYTMDPSYASNPGHLMWDYFLPFFTLLSMYGNHDGNKNRNENHDAEQLTRFMLISVDNECPSLAHCRKIVSKFLPLVGSSEMWTTSSIKLSAEQGHNLKSSLVCSQHGAVGIGMLTDHGFTRHGQNLDDYQRVHNAGRGATFYNFRSFMLNNLQVPASNTRRKVVFSINSTNNVHRKKDFRHQIAALRSHIQHVTIIAVELSQLSLRDQVELVADAAVFVSVVGGSTSVATLLPRGAAVVLYFCTEDSFVGKTKTKNFPTMMDFDFWNNASYLRLHWLPTGSMDESQDLAFLVQLIRTELDSLQFE